MSAATERKDSEWKLDVALLGIGTHMVRKPLVDLLGECRCKLDWSVTDGEFLQRIDDELAQVKERL